ncbi:hypothetical protein CS022_20280 [Veronia nyctiphanis]|uniref:Uncharacterized protein n=1 Tax=Veronia nyctiphanis TaxID=1278244 RepID=A0A4V1LSH1_9GAMM|nr:hypothetical protein [Veronia nyctiphanis]RXJ71678.1 hypothetical protein CS022_20280 [Veronia nyctiphanis]
MQSTPTLKDIIDGFPSISCDNAQKLESLLDKIDCPDDFRAFGLVIDKLKRLSADFHESFYRVFGLSIDDSFYAELININSSIYDSCRNNKPAKGWKSQRPIYDLLLTFSSLKESFSVSPLLCFLNHYFEHESEVKNADKEEESVRAFRLLYLDREFEQDCLNSHDTKIILKNLKAFKDKLMQREESDRPKSVINYTRDLIHFYQLNWKHKTSIRRLPKARLRASYSRRKIERVIGEDDIYTQALKNLKPNEFSLQSGISELEDYPPLLLVKHEPEVDEKLKHEIPSVSLIKDRHIDQLKSRTITKKIRRSHNLTLMSRHIFQPHELHYLWSSLMSSRKTVHHGVSGSVVRRLILLMLFSPGIRIQHDNLW